MAALKLETGTLEHPGTEPVGLQSWVASEDCGASA